MWSAVSDNVVGELTVRRVKSITIATCYQCQNVWTDRVLNNFGL
jgi:Zn-finger nucleic acid-binding protein